MNIKYTNQYLSALEDIFSESDYVLRYEKGNFKAGYCLLKDTKIAIVNKYFPLEGRVNALVEILKNIEVDLSKITPKSRKIYLDITQTELKL